MRHSIVAFAAALLCLGVRVSAEPGADSSTGLIGYWPFDNSGVDASGDGRDLVLKGGVGFAAGRFGQALDIANTESK